MKKNIILLNFVFLLVMGAVFYLSAYQLSKLKASDLEHLAIEKARSAVKVSVPSINRAIQNSDDISVLTNVESISKLENVASAFILDGNNTVIIHNNTNEWNSKREGEIYDRALKYKGELLQLSYDKDHILFSVPVDKGYVLCCIFSTRKASEKAGYWKIKYFTVAAVTGAALIIILYFLSKLFIVLPFQRTKRKIEKGAFEASKEEKYDEIADMFATENEKARQKIKALQQDKDNLTKIIEYYLGRQLRNYKLLIILDSSNGIVYSHDDTGKFLKKDFSENSNILEAALLPEIIDMVSESYEIPGTEVSGFIGEDTVTALALGEKDKIFATIIKI